MKVLIDTSSLLSLARYYLPFDSGDVLLDFFKDKISSGEIVVIDRVLEECKYQAKGLVLKSIKCLTEREFLKSSGTPLNTKDLIAPSTKEFLHHVNNSFARTAVKDDLSEAEFEVEKKGFLAGADMGLVIMCLKLKEKDPNDEVILVTEETEASNDKKVFQKIPAICKILGIATENLPGLLARYPGISVEFKRSSIDMLSLLV